MKKLYLRIAIILLPVLLYCIVFFAFDPYGYFGQSDAPKSTSTLTGKMLDFRNGEYDAILIGDSRIVNCDVSGLSDDNGYRYVNMSYGGCITEEMVRLADWCLENQNIPIKKIVIVTGFYNMNTLLQQDRVSTTEKVIENPFTYAFSVENFSAMLDNMKASAPENAQKTVKHEMTPEQKEKKFENHKNDMEVYLRQYTYDQEILGLLAEFCSECESRGIDISIVLPPWWDGYYDLLAEYGLLEILDDYKKQLSKYVVLYDFENRECPLSQNYNDFTDYSHFRGDTFERFVRAVLGEQTEDCKIWDNRTS